MQNVADGFSRKRKVLISVVLGPRIRSGLDRFMGLHCHNYSNGDSDETDVKSGAIYSSTRWARALGSASVRSVNLEWPSLQLEVELQVTGIPKSPSNDVHNKMQVG